MVVGVLLGSATLVRLRSGVPEPYENTQLSVTNNNVRYPHTSPARRHGTYRYVLGMNYWEQFSNAVRNYFALACVANDWRANTVRPFTAHSRLYGLPNVFLDDHFNESTPARDLGLILDLASMDSVLTNARFPRSVPLTEMLEFGERRLIFIHFVSEVSHREYAVKSLETLSRLKHNFQKSSVVDCSDEPEMAAVARLVTSNLNSRLRSDANRFQLHTYVCINQSHGITPTDLQRLLVFEEGNATVVVVNWRGLGNGTALIHSSKGVHTNKRITLAGGQCLRRRNKGKISSIQFSQTVLSAADKFMKELGVTEGEYAVVHIRSEKLVFRESRFPRLLSNCMSEALWMMGEVVGKRGLKVLFFADIGVYGSETCRQCSSVTRMRQLMKKYKFGLEHFSPTKYGLPPDSGFVAAVEMTVMSRAGHMILVGGGSFQTLLLQRFNSRRPGKGASTTLCSTDRQAKEMTQRFSPPQQQ